MARRVGAERRKGFRGRSGPWPLSPLLVGFLVVVGRAEGGQVAPIPRLESPLLIASSGVTQSAILVRDACQEIHLGCGLWPTVRAEDLEGGCDSCRGQPNYGALLIVVGSAPAQEGTGKDPVRAEIDRLTALVETAKRSFIPAVVGLFDRSDAAESGGCDRIAEALAPLADLVIALDGACADVEPIVQERGIPLVRFSAPGDLGDLLRQLFDLPAVF